MKRFALLSIVCYCLLTCHALHAEEVPYQVGDGTCEVNDAAGVALLQRDAIGTVLRWDSLTQPGRYRLTLRARFVLPELAALVVSTPGPHGLAHDTAPNGYLSDRPNTWKTLRFDFDVESGASSPPALIYPYVIRRVTRAAEATPLQIEKATLSLQKLPVPVMISWCRPTKLRYRLGGMAALEARLTNATATPQTVQLRPIVMNEADERTAQAARSFTIPAQTTVPLDIPFRLPTAEGGYVAYAEVSQNGKPLDARGDVFCVTNSPWQFYMSGGEASPRLPGFGSLSEARTLPNDPQRWAQFQRDAALGVEAQRRDYVTAYEYFAWAREDATLLHEPTDEAYLAGQVGWPKSPKALRLFNGLMRQQGIAPIAYVDAEPFGWPGFEIFRRHPEWFDLTAAGQPISNFNAQLLDAYEQDTLLAGSEYPVIVPRYEAVSNGTRYLDYHIAQLEGSVKQYGWEAFRYDAGPLPDALFPSVKARLAGLKPPVGIGNNLGIAVLGEQPDARWKTFTTGGSLMMEEAASREFGEPGKHGAMRDWTDWLKFARRGSQLTRRNGGHYLHINAASSWLSFAVGYALSGHPYSYSIYKNPFGDTERFMLRYGYLFWDLKTQLLDNAERTVSVHSAQPLWWHELVSQRALGQQRRQIIVPLINPLASEVTDSPSTGPASDVRVTFKPQPGERVTAWLLTPEPVARRVALPLKHLPTGALQVEVPLFWSWTNVVFDCSGAKVSELPPLSTPTAKGKRLSAAKTIYNDLSNVENFLMTSKQAAWDRGKLVQDGGARSGWALKADPASDKPGRGTMWFGYTYGQEPGKLRVAFRLKVADNTSPQPVAVIRTAISGTELDTPGAGYREQAIKGTDFKAPNEYQEFSMDAIKGERGFGDWAVMTNGVTPLWYDGLSVTQVSRFTLPELMALSKVPDKPAGLSLPAAPRVHEAFGLYHKFWQVAAATALLPGATRTQSTLMVHPQHTRLEGFPQKWDELYGNSIVALDNVPLKGVSLISAMMLKIWVEDGGTLVLMGDTHSLERGGWNDSPLASLLPVTLPAPSNAPFHRQALPLEARDASLADLDWTAKPYTLYAHAATPRPDAKIIVASGKTPLIVENRAGKGRVVVLLLSVLGEPDAKTPGTPFWQWKDWPKLLSRMLATKGTVNE